MGAIGFLTALCSAAGALFSHKQPQAVCSAEGAKPPEWQNKKSM